jgi:sugar O-acyltransferase (sialic acid O-acetyltransferase NeuD family)
MKLAIYGYGGHAKEVAATIKEDDITFFVDDEYCCENTKPISAFDSKKYKIIIAIGNSIHRKSIVDKLPKDTQYYTYIHPSVLILDSSVKIGEGAFIGPNCIITTNIKIGKHCILNRGVHIGHDCIIGDYFSAMPMSVVGGNVNICDCVYLGASASIKEKINIDATSVIGMSAAVVKNINISGTYVGVPAKKIS